jgi:Trypsin-like peptidase domain/Effector-associated domain 1
MAGAQPNGLVLTTEQKELLNQALRTTFAPSRLKYVFEYRLGRVLDFEFAPSYEALVQDVVRQAAGEGWADELVARAREAAPGSPSLRDIAEQLGLAASAPPAHELERLVAEQETFMAPEQWRARMALLESQVCRVEVGADGIYGLGTGFLVGPETVMTCHHVIRPVIERELAPDDVTFRFDYRRAAEGKFASDGTTFTMAEDRIVDSSPPAPNESGDGSSEPSEDALDYALVAVAGKPGATPVGGASDAPDDQEQPRGCVETPASSSLPAPGRSLFILQHPSGAPIKQAFGPVGEPLNGGARVKHAVNTLKGSSGSPCFDANLTLVAMHQAGDPLYDDASVGRGNKAVPVKAILERRERHGLPHDLGAVS